MGVAWMALKPQVFRHAVHDSELSQPMGGQATDALAELPASYSDAPKLGPPLPGDLGRPILRAQERAEDEAVPTRVDAAEPEPHQRLPALKPPRDSRPMAHLPPVPGPPSPPPAPSPPPPP